MSFQNNDDTFCEVSINEHKTEENSMIKNDNMIHKNDTIEEKNVDINNNYIDNSNDYDESKSTQPYDDETLNSSNYSNNLKMDGLCQNIYLRTNKKLSLKLCSKLEELVNKNMLNLDDIINHNLIELLIELNNSNEYLIAFDHFESEYESNENKVELLIYSISKWIANNQNKKDVLDQNFQFSNRPGPNETKLREILNRTGYSHDVSSGQRKYGGPPPNDDSLMAPPGCECFIGKLPRDLFEDELILLLEKQGKIWDLRLMIDPNSGYNKGYGFVTFCDKQSAKMAVKNLNEYEIRPGKKLRVNLSVANVKLFIKNIPKTKSKEELKNEFSTLVEGIQELTVSIQLDATENDKFKNRGFCFIEFIDHKSASIAKRKLSNPRYNKIFNREIIVDWADQNEEPDEEIMSKVKILYVKNISHEISEQDLEKAFEPFGKLERIRKMKDYAFVHFEKREDALKAMEELNNKELGKTHIDISLAKPQLNKKQQLQKRTELSNFHNNINFNSNSNNKNNFNNNNNINWINNNFQNQSSHNNNNNRINMNNYNNKNFNNISINQNQEFNQIKARNNLSFNQNYKIGTINNNFQSFRSNFSQDNKFITKNFNNQDDSTFCMNNKRKFDNSNDDNNEFNKKPRYNSNNFQNSSYNTNNQQSVDMSNSYWKSFKTPQYNVNYQYQNKNFPQQQNTQLIYQNDTQWFHDNFDSNQWI